MITLTDLPTEMLERILDELAFVDKESFSLVNHYSRAAAVSLALLCSHRMDRRDC